MPSRRPSRQDEQLNRIEDKLDAVLRNQRQEIQMEIAIMSALTDQLDRLEASVAANGDAEESAIALLNGLTTLINDLKNSVTDPAAVARIQAVADAVEAKKTALAAAITANTPAA